MWRSEAPDTPAPGRRPRRVAAARAAGLCVGTLLAAGCATPTLPGPAAPGSDNWAGRFAVTWTPPGEPARQERASGRFALREAAGRTELEVFSPFGQTIARALSDPGSASLETSDGRRFEAGDAETLTESVLGWRAPVQLLPGWLRGDLPDVSVSSGWSVRVDAREGHRPQRITISWPAGAVGAPQQVTIRLALDPDENSAPSASAR